MNTTAKLFTGVLLGRLEKWVCVNNIFNENQAGFRRGYFITDNNFNLISFISLIQRTKG